MSAKVGGCRIEALAHALSRPRDEPHRDTDQHLLEGAGGDRVQEPLHLLGRELNRSGHGLQLLDPAGVLSENVSSEHEADVEAVGRIGEDHLLQVVGRDPQPDGDGKEIDDLGGVGPKEVRSQDAAGALLNQHLEA